MLCSFAATSNDWLFFQAFREKRASLSDFDRFKVPCPLLSHTLVFIVTQFIRKVQKARQSRARVVRGGVRKATKGKAAAGGKAAGGKK